MENSYDAGFQLGRYLGAALFVVLILVFLHRASRSESRSLRLANLALSCGLTGLLLPRFGDSLWVFGALSGLGGLALAIVAASARRRDEGAGLVRIIIALVISAIALLGNANHFLLPHLLDGRRSPLEEPGASAWTHVSRTHDFQLRLPSSRWREASPGRSRIAFRHPSGVQLFVDSDPSQSEDDFDQRARDLAASMDRAAKGAAVNHRKGVNAKGCRYASASVMDRSDRSSPIFVAASMIWCPDKQAPDLTRGTLIHLLFEGQAGKHARAERLESTAAFIFDSVEDSPERS